MYIGVDVFFALNFFVCVSLETDPNRRCFAYHLHSVAGWKVFLPPYGRHAARFCGWGD